MIFTAPRLNGGGEPVNGFGYGEGRERLGRSYGVGSVLVIVQHVLAMQPLLSQFNLLFHVHKSIISRHQSSAVRNSPLSSGPGDEPAAGLAHDPLHGRGHLAARPLCEVSWRLLGSA